MTEWYGINYPFRGGTQNVLSRQVGLKLIKNDILQLIYTNPGERVYRPNFGVGILMYIHDQFDDVSIEDLKSRITHQISAFETRVNLIRLDVVEHRDDHKLNIYMQFNLVQSPNEVFELKLGLPILGAA